MRADIRMRLASGIASLVILAAPSTTRADAGSVLDRPEFDREISVQMQQAPLANVLRTLGAMTNVRFVLQFEPDPTVKVDLKAEHMVCRGILASLANTYDLEYFSSDEGVLVRRRGISDTTPTTPSSTRSEPPAHWFIITARMATGEHQTFPRMMCPDDKVTTRRFIVRNPDQEVSVLDGPMRAITTRHVGDFELSIAVTKDLGDRIEVSAEFVGIQRHSAARYTEEHLVAARTLPSSESLLFKSPRGDEVLVTAWGRVESAAN